MTTTISRIAVIAITVIAICSLVGCVNPPKLVKIEPLGESTPIVTIDPESDPDWVMVPVINEDDEPATTAVEASRFVHATIVLWKDSGKSTWNIKAKYCPDYQAVVFDRDAWWSYLEGVELGFTAFQRGWHLLRQDPATRLHCS